MIPNLPYELHELICNQLDVSTLQIYALTCRQFHSIAQKSIFAKVRLIYPRPTAVANNRTESLLELTESSPRICEAVGTVALIDKRHLPFSFALKHHWDDPPLCSLLLRFKNVRNFGIESLAFNALSWPIASVTVQKTFTEMFHSNALTNLALYRVVELPLDVLDGCTALEELSLEFVTFPKNEMDLFLAGFWEPPMQREKKTELKSLRLTLSDPLFHFFSLWITSPTCNLDVTALRSFSASMTMEYHDQGNISRILQACAKTVEIFWFCPTFQTVEPENTAINPIDISGLISLRILRLRLGMLAQALRRLNLHRRQSYLPWILQLINQLPTSNSVVEISLKVSLIWERELAGIDGTVDMAMWHPLDTLLSSYATKSLRWFRFLALEEEFALPDDVARDIKRAFPKLDEAKVLSVEMCKAIPGFFSVPHDGDLLRRLKIC